MEHEFQQIIAGMTGAQLIEALNGNSNITKLQFEAILTALASLVLGNNVKQIKVDNGKFLYTTDGTNWSSVDNNVWGSITGDITEQEDLQNALSGLATSEQLNTVSNAVGALSNSVEGLGTTVSSNTTAIEGNTSAIGKLQQKQAKQVSSDTIVLLRISSSGFMQYSLDGTSWINVQSEADINWGAIGGEIANQVDLKRILDSKVNNSTLNTHTTNKDNPHEVTKSQVGLGNVDNTSDADKPISTAQQEAFDALSESINNLNDNKMSVSEDVDALEYITLEDWNTKKEAGELSDTTIYIVD